MEKVSYPAHQTTKGLSDQKARFQSSSPTVGVFPYTLFL